MKKLLIVAVITSVSLNAISQKAGFRGQGYYSLRPRVSIGIGHSFGYSPFYRPFYSPNRGPGYRVQPSRLDLEIQDIHLDYADRIRSVRADRSIRGKERRREIRALKFERDRAVIAAKQDYYYRRRSTR